MANGQLQSLYGSNYRPVRQSTLIKDMHGQASLDVMARKKKEQEAQERKFDEQVAKDNLLLSQKQFKLNEDAAKEQARQARIGMGIEAGKLGLNMYDRFGGGNTGGGALSSIGNSLTSGLGKIGINARGMDFGSLASTGLVGMGAGALAGGDKGKAALYGAGAGLGMSLLNKGLSGGISNKLIDTGVGALSGLLGSLF